MAAAQWLQILLGYNFKLLFDGTAGNYSLVGGEENGEFFRVGVDGGMIKFSLVGAIPCQITQSMISLPLRFYSFFNYL